MAYISQLQDQVDETTELMKENIASFLERGEKLEQKVEEAKDLEKKAEKFQELAKEELEVEKKAANASKKLKLGIGGVIIVIFLISLLFAWMTLP